MDLVESLLRLALPLWMSVDVSVDIDVAKAGGKVEFRSAVFESEDPGLAEVDLMVLGCFGKGVCVAEWWVEEDVLAAKGLVNLANVSLGLRVGSCWFR